MEKRVSVIILSKNDEIINKIKEDLDILRFEVIVSSYPKVNIDDIYYRFPDIILMDITEIDEDVYTVCEFLTGERTIPEKTALTALVSNESISQIPLGYRFKEIITYPYDLTEFGFRLRRIVYQNQQEPQDDTIYVGGLSISPSRYQVKVEGKPIVFSYKEYQLFKYLITHPDRVFTRENLLENIWGETLVNGVRTVDVHIRRIRAKIGDIDNRYIKTVRGVGYAFSTQNE